MPPQTDTGSIILNESNPQLGSTVTFTTTLPDKGKPINPDFVYINLQAFKAPDHVLVWAQTGARTKVFTLGEPYAPTRWNSDSDNQPAETGAMQCRAELFYWANNGKYTVLASAEFVASGA